MGQWYLPLLHGEWAEVKTVGEIGQAIWGNEKNLAYLRKREIQMQYPDFLQAGWPIASSIVESANKMVVEARLKGSGMHWERANVDPMLALRNSICSDRWSEDWPQIVKRLRSQKTLQQKQLRDKHRQEKLPATPIVPVSLPKNKRASLILK